MADHQEQQEHESSAMSHSQHSQQQQQPELSFGLALAARKDSGAEQEECKFDDVMALQEEAIQVRIPLSSILHIDFCSWLSKGILM